MIGHRCIRLSLAVSALAIAAAAGQLSAQHFVLTDRNFLAGKYDSATVASALLPPDSWKPYPTIADRAAWAGMPDEVRQGHIAQAESLLGTGWPELPATVFLEYVRTGNRSNFQQIHFARREQLAKLVMGEVFEDEGRFLDDIVNGIWAISEETYWGIPAHLDIQGAGYGLPDVEEPTVDLFAAETASLMAWTLYLLGDKLDEVSPLVKPRIIAELKRRVLDPNLEREDFWWMAFDPSVINNWTPWVNSNWLTVVLIAEEDPARRSAAVYKIMRSVDVFINSYPDDGGCDEGPGYWTRAGGSLFEVLDLLHTATDGAIDIFDQPLIHEMGRFIIKGHVGGDYFINFADARPTMTPPAALVFRFGQRLGDRQMERFGAYFADRQQLGHGYIEGRFGHLARQLMTMFALDDLAQIEPSAPLMQDVWLPDIQVMTARTIGGSTKGLFVAAKGGHNEENHNHNDVGSFMIYADGEPVIIDLGPGTYTRTTFSEDRYTVWNFQSAYHNLPVVNGQLQPAGSHFQATDVTYAASEARAVLSMELASAYADDADVESWRRELTLERSGIAEVVVRDAYRLSSVIDRTSLHLMTTWSPTVTSDGVITLRNPDDSKARAIEIRYDADQLLPEIEDIPIEDEGLASSWGDRVGRIVLTVRDSALPSGELSVRISQSGPAPGQD